ncbi:hypothetical protein ACFSCX_13950 [Bacillus salitolerans]|uniref:Uncharacterized protein n=1 Tax=Bacillus salitolerans TaxID=1437434 RepID=A0ABW4LS08_9BACI
MKVYDTQFNANEWYFLLLLLGGLIIMIKLPKQFSLAKAITYFTLGSYLGMLLDHTISVEPFNFYDVNDTSNYSVFDFISYLAYGPSSFLFIYIYNRFQLKGFQILFYIVIWSLGGMCLEGIGHLLGAYHYLNGYKFLYSFPFYLSLKVFTICFYHLLTYFEGKWRAGT